MQRFLRSILIIARFTAAFCLVVVLSPVSDSRRESSPPLLSMLSAIDGSPSVVIWKSQYSLTLYKGSLPLKTYRAVFGRGYADGDKERVGDRRTPEGDFYVCSKNHSERFYKFLGLSYPGMKHAREGLRRGVISPAEYDAIARAIALRERPTWDTPLGGAIGIHGRTREDRSAQMARENWTDGCIALANADIDELYSVLQVGTPVTILP